MAEFILRRSEGPSGPRRWSAPEDTANDYCLSFAARGVLFYELSTHRPYDLPLRFGSVVTWRSQGLSLEETLAVLRELEEHNYVWFVSEDGDPPSSVLRLMFESPASWVEVVEFLNSRIPGMPKCWIRRCLADLALLIREEVEECYITPSC